MKSCLGLNAKHKGEGKAASAIHSSEVYWSILNEGGQLISEVIGLSNNLSLQLCEASLDHQTEVLRKTTLRAMSVTLQSMQVNLVYQANIFGYQYMDVPRDGNCFFHASANLTIGYLVNMHYQSLILDPSILAAQNLDEQTVATELDNEIPNSGPIALDELLSPPGNNDQEEMGESKQS